MGKITVEMTEQEYRKLSPEERARKDLEYIDSEDLNLWSSSAKKITYLANLINGDYSDKGKGNSR